MSNRAILPARGMADRLTGVFWRRPKLLLLLLVSPPLIWLGVIYLGSLLALLLQSFYSIDEFSGVVKEEFTLKTYAELFRAQNLDIILRTVVMATAVTLACAVLAFPIAYFAARYAKGHWKAAFYLGVMLPLWSSYLVKVYAWKLILAKEGILTWGAEHTGTSFNINGILSIPRLESSSLSTSPAGTFIAFVYVWLPYMILPMQAALERVPTTMLEASADLGATRGQTFRTVILPLAMPGVIAGSIFTFSLTLGDYIIPQIARDSARFIGLAVYQLQGTAGNTPLAAAFAVLPILPIALPDVITGMSLRSAFGIMDIPFSTWTIVMGHATFCMVIVFSNAVTRMRRLSGGISDAFADRGANAFQTFRNVLLPNLGSALLAGGMLTFALSFDEVIVTTFTAGQQSTLPIWMLNELVRPRQRPVTNVVAIVVFAATFLPILIAYYLTRGGSETAGEGK